MLAKDHQSVLDSAVQALNETHHFDLAQELRRVLSIEAGVPDDRVSMIQTLMLDWINVRAGKEAKAVWNRIEEKLVALAHASEAAKPSGDDSREKIARALHYPACWDTAAYPTLESAAWEAIACAKLGCSTCDSASEAAVGEPIDYARVVQICEAHGIGLPVDCIEMVVEIIRLAAPQPASEPASSCDPADICAGCRCKYNTYAQPASEQQAAAGWVSVADRLPESGKTVLATYQNRLGKLRRIRAQYIGPKTREHYTDYDELDGEYDETTDTYYWAAGWYECIDNWDDYSHVAVSEGAVTHWMQMPDAPALAAAKGGGQ